MNSFDSLHEIPFEDALHDLEACLKDLGLRRYFTVEALDQWIYNLEGTDDMSYISLPLSLLEEPDDQQVDKLIRAIMAYYPHRPQARLGGESPNQRKKNRPSEAPKGAHLITTELSLDEFFENADNGIHAFTQGKAEETIQYYDTAFKVLLEKKMTFSQLYRIVANKGMAHLLYGDEIVGVTLLNKSLELNPKYVFAQRALDSYEAGLMDAEIEQGKFLRQQKQYELLKKYDVDKIITWSEKKILKIFAKSGVQLDKKTFIHTAKKHFETKGLLKELIDLSFNPPPDVIRDFDWMGAQALWYQWCPEVANLDLLMHFLGSLDNEDDYSDIPKTKVREIIDYLLLSLPKAPTESGERFKQYVEYHDYLRSLLFLFEMRKALIEPVEKTTILKELDRITGDPISKLMRILSMIADGADKKAVLGAVGKLESSYSWVISDWAFENDQLGLAQLLAEKAIDLIEKSEANLQDIPKYEVRQMAGTLRVSYELLEELAEARGDKKTSKAYRVKLKQLDKRFDSWPMDNYLAREKMADILAQLDKEVIEKDPAIQYLRYFETLGVNLETDEEVDAQKVTSLNSEAFGMNLGRTSVGRNDPCPCSSGKKYKKCCYLN